jgi:hypothetical protein
MIGVLLAGVPVLPTIIHYKTGTQGFLGCMEVWKVGRGGAV